MIAKMLRTIIPARFRPGGHLEYLALKRTKGRILHGPFSGMRFANHEGNSAGCHIAKLLGIYERELNPYIERACALNFPLIVNIGAAEGYYAVGMALRNPAARVIAFETDANARAALAEKATLNNLGNCVEVRGKCEPENLEGVLAGVPRSLVICDVEGHESLLLDLIPVPSLRHAFILAELHEFVERGISEKIRKRFFATHKITHIRQEERAPANFPFDSWYTRCLPKRYLHWAVGESRPERMSWFWMEPHLTRPRGDETAGQHNTTT